MAELYGKLGAQWRSPRQDTLSKLLGSTWGGGGRFGAAGAAEPMDCLETDDVFQGTKRDRQRTDCFLQQIVPFQMVKKQQSPTAQLEGRVIIFPKGVRLTP